MHLTPQDVSALSEQMLSAALNGDRAYISAFVQRVGDDSEALGAVATSVHSQLAENGVSERSPVGQMVVALSSKPDVRLRFLGDHESVLAEYGLVSNQMLAIDLDDEDFEAVKGAGYTNP